MLLTISLYRACWYITNITDINCRAPRYRPGRTIVPATKDRFTNNLPDLSQLLCVLINTNELDKITSNMGTIFSNTLKTVAPSFNITHKHVNLNTVKTTTTFAAQSACIHFSLNYIKQTLKKNTINVEYCLTCFDVTVM